MACKRSGDALMTLAHTVAAIALTSGVATAQESGRVGVVMSYPARVGVRWHVTDRVAILPDIAFERTVSGTVFQIGYGFGSAGGNSFTGTTTRTSSTRWQTSPGANLLIDLRSWDEVATYVTVGWSYVRSSLATSETTTTTGGFTSLPPDRIEQREVTSHGYETRGAFGVRYIPHRHFGLFGEVGVEYRKSDFEVDLSVSMLRNRGVAGAVFYF
jgi:hypothetical protein